MTDALDNQAHDTAKLLADSADRIHDDLDRMARLLAKMRGLCFVTPSELDKIERLRQAAKIVVGGWDNNEISGESVASVYALTELEEALKE